MAKDWHLQAVINRAKNTSTAEEELAILWDHPDLLVRHALALNASAPLHILERIIQVDDDWQVVFQASQNLSRRDSSPYFLLDPEVITGLLEQENEATPEDLATLRDLPPSLSRALFVATPTRGVATNDRRHNPKRHQLAPETRGSHCDSDKLYFSGDTTGDSLEFPLVATNDTTRCPGVATNLVAGNCRLSPLVVVRDSL